ncbi:MAG: DegT/DnrJ/EryC1/StrS family aminotransferase [Deltaproteobacteria bacterium]|nr:DegT/DnrJ/EryC1/StrS family aminotransferase [Nannocystaceae bacterium]
MNPVPFVNLKRQIDELRPALLAAVDAVLHDQSFIQGPHVEQFELDFARAHGIAHAIGCANGTVAISLALEALGVGPGHEVIVPAHTFAATAAAVCHVGATPVFADIEPGAYTLDPHDVEAKLGPATKAVIPVHIYGTPCRMDQLVDVAAKGNDVFIVEDSAQAHLARYRGESVGTRGHAATFSFYPGKNLGGYGDAGAILTQHASVAARLRKLRDHGRSGKYLHEVLGYNCRMDGIQAAMLAVKLPYLEQWTNNRRAVAARYDENFVSRGFKVIQPPADSSAVYHLYIIEVSNRDEVQEHMRERGIATGIHYPVPLHRQPAFAKFARGSLPVTERAAERIVSVPICGSIDADEQRRVIESFLEVAQP